MAAIGVDTYAPSPAAIGSSVISPAAAASGQAAAAAAVTPAPTPAATVTTTAAQPLNTTGPLGTNVNIVA
jgi:hypothetical protein